MQNDVKYLYMCECYNAMFCNNKRCAINAPPVVVIYVFYICSYCIH